MALFAVRNRQSRGWEGGRWAVLVAMSKAPSNLFSEMKFISLLCNCFTVTMFYLICILTKYTFIIILSNYLIFRVYVNIKK